MVITDLYMNLHHLMLTSNLTLKQLHILKLVSVPMHKYLTLEQQQQQQT